MAKETKEMVAVRLDPWDRRKLKAVAKRLKVSESDFLRYAIKVAIEDFSPLVDQSKEGAQLLSAFVQHIDEKSRWLELDRAKLDYILHGDLEDEARRVAAEDIELLLKGSVGKGYHEWLMDMSSQKRAPASFMLSRFAYLMEKYVEPTRDEEWIERELENRRKDAL